MKKIATVVGARPQFIKAAVLSRIIREQNTFQECIIHTGQHFDHNMSDIFFDEMDIPKPNHFLDIHGLTHGAMTGRMLEQIEGVLLKEKPDLVLVYGDTNTTLAGALAAKKIHIPVAHIEAGLRSFNMDMPEEINRILTDRISDILFSPTQTGIDNLKKEGFDHLPSKVVLTGDIMLDAAWYYSKNSASKSTVYKTLNLKPEQFTLCTIHRQENTDDLAKLKDIIEALNEIHKTVHVLVPLHPRTQKIIKQNNLECNFQIIDPVGYFDMIELLKNCRFVMTDSGGLQKEAYYFLKNSIILREQTEWVELTQNNFSVLAGSDNHKIKDAFEWIKKQANPVLKKELFGDGHTGELIHEILKPILG